MKIRYYSVMQILSPAIVRNIENMRIFLRNVAVNFKPNHGQRKSGVFDVFRIFFYLAS